MMKTLEDLLTGKVSIYDLAFSLVMIEKKIKKELNVIDILYLIPTNHWVSTQKHSSKEIGAVVSSTLFNMPTTETATRIRECMDGIIIDLNK